MPPLNLLFAQIPVQIPVPLLNILYEFLEA